MGKLNFHSLGFGNVQELSEVVLGSSRIVSDNSDVYRRPYDAPIWADITSLITEHTESSSHLRLKYLPERDVVWMVVFSPSSTKELLLGSSEEVAHGLIHTRRHTVEVDERGSYASL